MDVGANNTAGACCQEKGVNVQSSTSVGRFCLPACRKRSFRSCQPTLNGSYWSLVNTLKVRARGHRGRGQGEL